MLLNRDMLGFDALMLHICCIRFWRPMSVWIYSICCYISSCPGTLKHRWDYSPNILAFCFSIPHSCRNRRHHPIALWTEDFEEMRRNNPLQSLWSLWRFLSHMYITPRFRTSLLTLHPIFQSILEEAYQWWMGQQQRCHRTLWWRIRPSQAWHILNTCYPFPWHGWGPWKLTVLILDTMHLHTCMTESFCASFSRGKIHCSLGCYGFWMECLCLTLMIPQFELLLEV